MAATSAVLQSEWTKIRSVRSTVWTLALAFLVTVALGAVICLVFDNTFSSLSASDKLTFDPTNTSFFGMTLGQLALIVFGVLVISSEYSTGMIRTSLAAVPQRGEFYLSKVTVAGVLALVVGEATSFITFFLGQALLGPHKAHIGDPGVLRAVFGAGLYMTLLVLFCVGAATMLRSPMLGLGVLMPFFFLVSPILSAVPKVRTVARYFPDQAGQKILQVVPSGDEHTSYGPWGGILIMAVWVVVALLGGYAVLRKRDA
ncbi:ABC-2 family transporter protein [Streptomyces sp. DvalAA-14]|uniref:ABC transporter permease subunit n=1 Tax=unclassified Streptomyces TaxID=2593676 RepID=UPI00081B6AC0|nr:MULTISPECIES: ABC transporter permease subunit [unclassified Streptomyces]MYS20756.1 ABC transporter permease subunit [Streptomyces sp. SID4948]SCD76621.1 ABC-2 family transporter protein [Streptomyces sp. DvalAA-14]